MPSAYTHLLAVGRGWEQMEQAARTAYRQSLLFEPLSQDIFISTWSLQRSETLWGEAELNMLVSSMHVCRDRPGCKQFQPTQVEGLLL